MTDYAFVTTWRLEAPIEDVFALIHDSLEWPDWWAAVSAVSEVATSPGPSGVGNVRRYTFRGALPYSLSFDLEVTRVERPNLLAGEASGELEGTGVWTLDELAGATIVRYDWTVRTTRWWMNLLAPIAGPIFRANHDRVMRSGLEGIQHRLGVTPQVDNTSASTPIARNSSDR